MTFATTLAEHAGFSRWIINAKSLADAVGQFRTLTTTLTAGAAPAVSGAASAATTAAASTAAAGTAGAAVNTAAAGTAGAAATGGAGAAALAVVTGPVGIAIAALGAAAVGAGLALRTFAALVKSQAQQLEAYSGTVSLATSETELRRERAMFRRADRIGPDVAKWERLRGEATERLADIATEIIDAIFKYVEPLEPVAREILELLKLLPPGMELTVANLDAIRDVLTMRLADIPTDLADIAAAQDKLAKAIKDYIDRKPEEDLSDKLIDDFFSIGEERRRADAGRARL